MKFDDTFNCNTVEENMENFILHTEKLEDIIITRIRSHLLFCNKCMEYYDNTIKEHPEYLSDINIPDLPNVDFVHKRLKKEDSIFTYLIELREKWTNPMEKYIYEALESARESFSEHPANMALTLSLNEEENIKIVDFCAKGLDKKETINLKALENELPQITPDGHFYSRFYSHDIALENKILFLHIKLPNEQGKLTLQSQFLRNNDVVEAVFSGGTFDCSYIIDDKDYIELFIS